MKHNGAVVLTRELRLRIDPAHRTSLEALAKMFGWFGPTELAETLLAKAIEQEARIVAQRKFLDIIMGQFQCGRIG